MARPNLNDPKLAVAVLALLAVVAGVNLKTYVLDRDGGRSVRRALRDPGPPADLAALVEDVLDDSDLISVEVADVGDVARRPVRDPFHYGAAPAAAAAAAHRPVDPLACTAIIVDGSAPSALIGGRWHVVGDRVAGHEIVGIDARGARVIDAGGRERRLPVRSGADDSDYLITFDARHDIQPEQPDVADGPENERRER